MSRLLIPVLLCGVCACAVQQRDYGVKLCGREFIRAVIFTCGGSRWRRAIDLQLPGHGESQHTHLSQPAIMLNFSSQQTYRQTQAYNNTVTKLHFCIFVPLVRERETFNLLKCLQFAFGHLKVQFCTFSYFKGIFAGKHMQCRTCSYTSAQEEKVPVDTFIPENRNTIYITCYFLNGFLCFYIISYYTRLIITSQSSAQ